MDCEQRENTDVLFSYFSKRTKKNSLEDTRKMTNIMIFINLILLIWIKEKIKSNNIRH